MTHGFFRLLSILALALCMTAATALGERIDQTIKVSPDKSVSTNGGVFEGWGTSLCWWANRLGYSDTLAQLAVDAVFGPDGLRLNIMRYNIGGGDAPSHRHITRTDSAVPGWLVWDDAAQTYVYDYTADLNQINVMQRAVQAVGEDALVEVFSNSPPYFMTESGCSSGAQKADQNNLRQDCAQDFAEYLVHVTAYIKNDLGMPVVSLSPMNEPNTDYWKAYTATCRKGVMLTPEKASPPFSKQLLTPWRSMHWTTSSSPPATKPTPSSRPPLISATPPRQKRTGPHQHAYLLGQRFKGAG